MKNLIILALLIGAAVSRFHESKTPFVTQEFVDNHKQKASFETYSYENHPFKGFTRSDLKALLGANIKEEAPKTLPSGDLRALPTNFDSRDQWKNCVFSVKNQGHCGSCWAFAASEVLSDRLCIESQGKVVANLSPQDLVSCDYLNFGCNGGNPVLSWITLRFKGVVKESCWPYQSGDGHVPSCPWFSSNCADGSTWTKFYAKNFYLFGSIQEIKENIYAKGPVETGFMVYADFMNYSKGIYVRNSNDFLGGHAVKVVGWGVEGGVNYWVVQNSWGSSWGEGGFFRIKEGECNFEGMMIAGDAYVN